MIPKNSILNYIIYSSKIDDVIIALVAITLTIETIKNIIVIILNENKDEKKQKLEKIKYIGSIILLVAIMLSKKSIILAYAIFILAIIINIVVAIKVLISSKLDIKYNIIYIIFGLFAVGLLGNLQINNYKNIVADLSLYSQEAFLILLLISKLTIYSFAILIEIIIISSNLITIIGEIIDFVIIKLEKMKSAKKNFIKKNKIVILLKCFENIKKIPNDINTIGASMIKLSLLIALIATYIIIRNPIYCFLDSIIKCFEVILFSSLIPLIISMLSQKKNQ